MRIKPLSIISATVAALASSAAAQTQSAAMTAQCATSGAASVSELHKAWILVGWDKPVAGQPWDFRGKLGKHYDWEASDVMLYDDMSPDFRIARSPEEYRALWEASFQALRRAHHLVLNGPETIVGDDLATSTLEFAARLEPAAGQPIISVRARSTLVWRCTGDAWKIVREHNSTRRIMPEESQQIFGF
ncbi:SnoaL-like domain-containing protein [Rhizobium laguerreae]|uniref:YybH family protein n=1 Tax=Rhizobium laguerreae TaxID=1076926 RepID=UPI001C929C99|nr:nuclear transport factor 2 family protein [Rhizobium laguerreae]MBY3088939.1 SnoaL-like domain-containing protein [Rhizobium laguerreae]